MPDTLGSKIKRRKEIRKESICITLSPIAIENLDKICSIQNRNRSNVIENLLLMDDIVTKIINKEQTDIVGKVLEIFNIYKYSKET